jgi:hypothetical protein
MKYFFVFCAFLFLTLQSCSLQRRLDKYCPLCPVKDSTIIETVYKDTNIYIPGETVTIVDSVYCDSLGNVYALRLSEKDGDIVNLKTQLKNNKYTATASTDTIVKTIQLPSKTITKVITLPPKIEQYIPWWASFLAVVGGISLIILLLSLGFRYLKNMLNIKFPLR